ncbi:VPLPA-CTERM sorting domain-containing protein [Albimonas sp. CAU 1670]|uniref:VPLPA-CTERM sorting domain-containing protein n=1 Tax=Albimonas sp. CAU 1670 TaxID=3032599 RepID=UPI0023DAF7FD|nr:VPLPA-CTERM sorting domain-containing protein [Albimonas sp. CAU 1670]MDF2232262.1 VPLPA-CTERM sorting domain-containing protein [Albimonas sp. CAU 1670]
MRLTLAAAAAATIATPASALITHDTNVTPNVQLLFGQGNANTAFAVDLNHNIEVGLRGKLRYPDGPVADRYNSDGNGLYTFAPSSASAPPDRSIFNFDWSVNVDQDGTSGAVLADYTYRLSIDYDPSAAVGTVLGTDLIEFDPIGVTEVDSWDHGLGDNGATSPTLAKQYVATDEGGLLGMNYAPALSTYSVAQNSWNLGFFEPTGFDPQTLGLYTITLSVFDLDTSPNAIASSSIDVLVSEGGTPVPVPAALPLLAVGMAALGVAARRRRA